MAGRVRGPDLLDEYFPRGGEAAAAIGPGGLMYDRKDDDEEEPAGAAAIGSGELMRVSTGGEDDDEEESAGAAIAAAAGGGGADEDDATMGRRLPAPAAVSGLFGAATAAAAGGGGGGGLFRTAAPAGGSGLLAPAPATVSGRFGAATAAAAGGGGGGGLFRTAAPAGGSGLLAPAPAAPAAGAKRSLAKREEYERNAAAAGAPGAAAAVPSRVGPPAKRTVAMLTDPEKVHPIAILTPSQIFGLAHADNLHDAANGYRNRTPTLAAEVRDALLIAFKRGNRGCPLVAPDIASCLTQQLGDDVLQSKVEETTMGNLERTHSYLQQPSPDAKATYDNILAMAVDALAKRNAYDTFKILPPATGTRVKNYNAADKEKITKFILNFLLGTDVAPTYMTFDAAPKTVGKLFAGHPTVCGLIMPQNVGDSASTSFIQLGKEPNLYIFPFTNPADTSVFYSKRNVLSQDLLRTFYQDNGFSAKFPFKFRFGIESVANPVDSVSVSYQDGGYKQGPSLDYLIDLMLAAQGGVPRFGNIKPTSACLQIGQIIDSNPNINARVRETLGGIFMDIKREGDQDVCDALHSLLILSGFIKEGKFVILVTIDRLCSLLARLLGIPCIYHYGDELTLYKNTQTDRGIDPEQKAAFIAKKQEKFIAAYGGLVDAYSDRAKLRSFLCSFRNHTAFEGSPVDKLRRNRIVDMFNKLKAFHDFLELQATKDAITATEAAKEQARVRELTAKGQAIVRELTADDRKFIRISSFLETVNAAGYDTVFLSGLLPNISPGVQVFNPDSDYSFLNYSADDFSDLATAKSKIDALIGRDKSLRDVENYDRMLAGPEGYNTLLKEVISTFFDQDHAEAAFTALQYKPSAIPDARIIEARQQIAEFEQKSAEIAGVEGLTMAILAKKKALRVTRELAIAATTDLRTAFRASMDAPPVVNAPVGVDVLCPAGQGGGAYVQSGGAVEPHHIELFAEICSKAAQFINSEIFKSFPLVFQRYAMQSFVENLFRVYSIARTKVRTEGEKTNLQERVEQLTRSKELLENYAELGERVLDKFIEAYNDIIDSRTMNVKDSAYKYVDILQELIAGAGERYNITIENIIAKASASDASALLNELYTLWDTRDSRKVAEAAAARRREAAAAAAAAAGEAGEADVAMGAAGGGGGGGAAAAARRRAATAAAAAAGGGGGGAAAGGGGAAAAAAAAAAADNTSAMITLLLDPYSDVAIDIVAIDTHFSDKGEENEKYQRIKNKCAAEIKCAGVVEGEEDAVVEGAEDAIVEDEEGVVVVDPPCVLPADDVHLIGLTGLKTGYPLHMIGRPEPGRSPVRTSFLQKLLIDDLQCGIYSRVPMYSLITLAYINDLLNGTLSKNQSLITSILSPTVFARSFNIYNPFGTDWEKLSRLIIPNILIGINNGSISREAIGLTLAAGGARSNRTRRHRRSRRRGHITRRRTK